MNGNVVDFESEKNRRFLVAMYAEIIKEEGILCDAVLAAVRDHNIQLNQDFMFNCPLSKPVHKVECCRRGDGRTEYYCHSCGCGGET